MSYIIQAETKDGSTGITETFKTRYYALRAAKTALKKGMVITKIGEN